MGRWWRTTIPRYKIAGLQDRWNVLSTATHIFQPPFHPHTWAAIYSRHFDNLDFSDRYTVRPYGLEGPFSSGQGKGLMGACYGCPSQGLGARPAWSERVIPWPWACCPALTPLGGQNRRKHGLTLVYHRSGSADHAYWTRHHGHASAN